MAIRKEITLASPAARRTFRRDGTGLCGAIHRSQFAGCLLRRVRSRLARPGGGDKSQAAAKQHYERALALSQGKHLALFVSWAEGVCVPKQDRKGFNALLDRVLEFQVDQVPEAPSA